MLRITIELVPLGIESRARVIATGTIANTGTGTPTSGDYRIELRDAAGRKWKSGHIEGFPRKRLLAWDLLYRALRKLVGNRNRQFRFGRRLRSIECQQHRSAQRTGSMNARRLHAILKRHEIDPKFWPEFRAMVELGQNTSKELWTRMNRVANYKAARIEIACANRRDGTQISARRLRIPAGYDFDMSAEHESLNPEEVVLATSGGCAV